MKNRIIILTLICLLIGLSSCDKSAKVERFIELGDIAMREEKFNEAAQHFTEALKLDPSSYRALVGRADANIFLGEFEASLLDISEALLQKTTDPRAQVIRAKALDCLGQPKEAERILDNLVKSGPENGRFYFERANHHAKNWNLKKAFQDYNTSIKLAPSFSEAYLNRGILYHKTGKYDKAIDDFTTAIQYSNSRTERALSPTAFAYYNRGSVYFRKGRQYTAKGNAPSAEGNFRKAKEDWSKAHELAPRTTVGRMSARWVETMEKNGMLQ